MIKKIYEFFFSRWKCEIHGRCKATWHRYSTTTGMHIVGSDYEREYVDYKYTNKFDGSVKIKRIYL